MGDNAGLCRGGVHFANAMWLYGGLLGDSILIVCCKTSQLAKKISKTNYKVCVHFSNNRTEIMSDKIKRTLKNEIQQM